MILANVFVSDASSSNEAVHLQQRLRSLSTELVTLRNRLHVNQPPNNSGPNSAASAPLSKSPEKGGVPSSPAPAVPPRTTLPISGALPHSLGHPSGHTLTASAIVHPHVNHAVTANTLGHNSTAANNLISGQYAAVLRTCNAVHARPPTLRVTDSAGTLRLCLTDMGLDVVVTVGVAMRLRAFFSSTPLQDLGFRVYDSLEV